MELIRKIYIKAIICLTCIIVSIMLFPFNSEVFAETFEYGDWYCETINENEVGILGNFNVGTSVAIPEKINGKTVTKICDDAFNNQSGITSVEIPNSVTYIGDKAFYCCVSLEDITMSENIKYIGEAAFESCFKLESINLPDGLNTIGASAFLNCGLKSVIIPDSVNDLGNDVFLGCEDLTDVSIPKDIVSIPYGLFYCCTSLEKVELPDSITSIGDSAFSGCEKLKEINIPNGVSYIGEYSFNECTLLTPIVIPDSVSEIGACAFRDCKSVTNIVIPKDITAINDYTFNGCDNLVNIYLPNGIKSIGAYSFSECTELIGINIPSGVTSIGEGAFYNCENLENVSIPDGITIIQNETFCGCKNIKQITIPANVSTIGDTAFYSCGITSIIIPEKTTTIGNSAFSFTNLTSLEIPKNVKSIGCDIIAYCYYLTDLTVSEENEYYSDGNGNNLIIEKKTGKIIQGSVATIIPDGVTSIGDYAFYGIGYDFANKKLPDSLTKIGKHAFDSCEFNVEEIVLPDNIVEIDDYAFVYTGYFMKIDLPQKLERIGDYAFYYSRDLRYINIPDTVTSIGEYAFSGCEYLTNIELPEGITEIKDFAFYGCKQLGEIEIPMSVTSINKWAFGDCILNKVIIYDNVDYIDDDAFIYNNYNNMNYYDREVTIYTTKDSYADRFAQNHNIPVVYLNSTETIKFYRYDSATNTVGSEISIYSFKSDSLEGCELPDILVKTYRNIKGETIPASMELEIQDEYKKTVLGNGNGGFITDENGEYVLQGYTITFAGSGKSLESYSINCSAGSAYAKLQVQLDKLELYSIAWDNSESIVNLKKKTFKNDMEYRYYSTSFNHVILSGVDTNGSYEVYSDLQCNTKSNREWDLSNNSEVTFYIKLSREGYNDVKCVITITKVNKEVIFTDNGHDTKINCDFDPYKLINGLDYESDNDNAIAGIILSGLIENGEDRVFEGLKQLGLYEGYKNSSTYYYSGFGYYDGVGRIIAVRKIKIGSTTHNIVTIVARGTSDLEDVAIDATTGMFNECANTLVEEIDSVLSKNGIKYIDDKTHFFVTGHSLGGAVANLVSAKLIDEKRVIANHLKCYTFASPLTKSDIDLGYNKTKYATIKNIYNSNDIVPRVSPTQTLGLLGPTSVRFPLTSLIGALEGRYGIDIELNQKMNSAAFNKYYKMLQEENFTEGILSNHSTSAYLALVLANGASTSMNSKKRIIYVHCPVDVDIIDSSGQVCVKIENDTVMKNITEDVYAFVIGDTKVFLLDYDSKYKISITGYDSGEMGIEIIDYNNDGISDIVTSQTEYCDILVDDGKNMVCEVDDSINADDIKVYVTDEKGEAVSEIKQDGSEKPIIQTPAPSATASEMSTSVPTAVPTPKSTDDKKPAAVPSVSPTPAVSPDNNILPIGEVTEDSKGKAKYKVLKTAEGGAGTVMLVAPVSKNNKSFIIPDKIIVNGLEYKVAEIKANAFKNNKKLKSVAIGSNVNKVGKNAFYGCKKLKTISIKTKLLTSKSVGTKAFSKISKKPTVKIPKSKIKAYKKWIYKKGLSKKARIKS
ncbi:MAG: leucine-rich repeat protein [Eubacterium sp.]|nr:leucine-rich repeat protein [Eubacterium sp.]